ncbi:response regulator transcription factor [Pontiellaceae bacterium B1224]|nr:response regulator transcription factor [Pontiellaceae bacterium B1224]
MKQSKQIQILLVDDHGPTRELLKNLIEKNDCWKVYTEAASGNEAIEVVEQEVPDLIVMDMQMADGSGLEAARVILSNHPDLPILMVSNYIDQILIQTVLKAGVLGYISKENAFEELSQAIESVSRKEIYLGAAIKWQLNLT